VHQDPHRHMDMDSGQEADSAPDNPRTVLLASPRSFCAGVERAIKVVEAALASVRSVELAHRHGTAAHLIDRAADIDPAWLDAAATVVVTAGASAPSVLVEQVIAVIREQGPATVSERTVTAETVRLALPKKVHTP